MKTETIEKIARIFLNVPRGKIQAIRHIKINTMDQVIRKNLESAHILSGVLLGLALAESTLILFGHLDLWVLFIFEAIVLVFALYLLRVALKRGYDLACLEVYNQ